VPAPPNLPSHFALPVRGHGAPRVPGGGQKPDATPRALACDRIRHESSGEALWGRCSLPFSGPTCLVGEPWLSLFVSATGRFPSGGLLRAMAFEHGGSLPVLVRAKRAALPEPASLPDTLAAYLPAPKKARTQTTLLPRGGNLEVRTRLVHSDESLDSELVNPVRYARVSRPASVARWPALAGGRTPAGNPLLASHHSTRSEMFSFVEQKMGVPKGPSPGRRPALADRGVRILHEGSGIPRTAWVAKNPPSTSLGPRPSKKYDGGRPGPSRDRHRFRGADLVGSNNNTTTEYQARRCSDSHLLLTARRQKRGACERCTPSRQPRRVGRTDHRAC